MAVSAEVEQMRRHSVMPFIVADWLFRMTDCFQSYSACKQHTQRSHATWSNISLCVCVCVCKINASESDYFNQKLIKNRWTTGLR